MKNKLTTPAAIVGIGLAAGGYLNSQPVPQPLVTDDPDPIVQIEAVELLPELEPVSPATPEPIIKSVEVYKEEVWHRADKSVRNALQQQWSSWSVFTRSAIAEKTGAPNFDTMTNGQAMALISALADSHEALRQKLISTLNVDDPITVPSMPKSALERYQERLNHE